MSNEIAGMPEFMPAGERSPREWVDYCREGERESVRATIEWCRRVYEAKQNLQITFREWADSYYETYAYSALCQLAKVGEQADGVFNNIKQRDVANDWGTLYQITTLEPEELNQIEGQLNQKTIGAFKKQKTRQHKTNQIKLSSGVKYPLIYADPPWRYEYSETTSREIENQYPTMSLIEICDLPIDDISQDDCVLLMWTTSPKLRDSMDVLDAWGFEYRTCAVWDKEVIGMGYYFRQQHEILLVATKGNVPVPEPANRPSSIFTERRGKHSSKPEIAYQLIESMYPELPKIELFARSKRDGWAVWGNQV